MKKKEELGLGYVEVEEFVGYLWGFVGLGFGIKRVLGLRGMRWYREVGVVIFLLVGYFFDGVVMFVFFIFVF